MDEPNFCNNNMNKGLLLEISELYLVLIIALKIANGTDLDVNIANLDEMPLYLGLHCLHIYPFYGTFGLP